MKSNIIKKILLAAVLAGVIGVGALTYIYFQPHRDVQGTDTDYTLKASDIVNEYLNNAVTANEKYLDEEGESKILEISGTVNKIEEDYEGKTVIILRDNSDKAGVSCTLKLPQKAPIKIGSELKIKGVIRSGAAYDADLEMYEPVIMEECEIINQ